jgi:menaquinone-dependent protoporphyrinogen oxidase
MPSAFVSVCLGVLENKPETNEQIGKILNTFYKKTGWHPSATQVVAGAIPYTRYGFLKKWEMRRIASKFSGDVDTSRDYEYTDWPKLKEFTLGFVANRRDMPLIERKYS